MDRHINSDLLKLCFPVLFMVAHPWFTVKGRDVIPHPQCWMKNTGSELSKSWFVFTEIAHWLIGIHSMKIALLLSSEDSTITIY